MLAESNYIGMIRTFIFIKYARMGGSFYIGVALHTAAIVHCIP